MIPRMRSLNEKYGEPISRNGFGGRRLRHVSVPELGHRRGRALYRAASFTGRHYHDDTNVVFTLSGSLTQTMAAAQTQPIHGVEICRLRPLQLMKMFMHHSEQPGHAALAGCAARLSDDNNRRRPQRGKRCLNLDRKTVSAAHADLRQPSSVPCQARGDASRIPFPK